MAFFYYVLLASRKVEAAIVQHRHLGTTRPSIDTFRIPSTLRAYVPLLRLYNGT